MKASVRDPWRVGRADVAKKKAEKRKTEPATTLAEDEDNIVIGTATSDHPLDADLKMDQLHLLRAPGQDFSLLINADDTPMAIHVLMRACQNTMFRCVLEDAGFTFSKHEVAKPQGFVLTDGEYVLWHAQVADVASGFRALVQALLRGTREERGFAERLRQLGITPLLP